MSGPPVDVLLPFYGDLPRLQLAVDSVLGQDHEDFRLICVDDRASNPEAGEWVRSLSDPRLQYVKNPKNLGLAKNFSRCVELATADRFVMMGADDIMLPEYISTVLTLAGEAPSAAIVQPGVRVIDDDGEAHWPLADRMKSLVRPRTGGRTIEMSGEALARSLTRADWAYFPSILWLTSSVKRHGFNERYPIALDLALMLDIILAGGSLLLDDREVFLYRRHRKSESATTASDGTRFVQELQLYEDYAGKFGEIGWRRARREARYHVMTRLNAASEAGRAAFSGQWSRTIALAALSLR